MDKGLQGMRDLRKMVKKRQGVIQNILLSTIVRGIEQSLRHVQASASQTGQKYNECKECCSQQTDLKMCGVQSSVMNMPRYERIIEGLKWPVLPPGDEMHHAC